MQATKYVLEGSSESLAIETEPLGIRVMIVQPGPFRTGWSGRSLQESGTVIDDYDWTAGARRRASKANSGEQVGDPSRGAKAIVDAITSEHPPVRLVLGKPATFSPGSRFFDRLPNTPESDEFVGLSQIIC